MIPDPDCVFCTTDGGVVLHVEAAGRIVWPNEPDHPSLLRVIAATHAREVTDLEPAARARLFALVCATELALRALVRPDKVNVASLGNVTPHVHWHVIPRFADDAFFPLPIWSARQRVGAAHPLPADFATRVRGELDRNLRS
jgi:diadenosine tetraphosphate (Ap4A) HIT family hydrolase